jgi:hypothetical protein
MGVQLINTLAGMTNGTIITVDYTSDFTALNSNLVNITAELKFIDANITILNSNLAALTTTMNSTIGVAGSLLPGTSANSAMLSKDILSIIAETLISMQQNQNDLTQSVSQIQFGLSGVSGAMQEAVATQQLAVADQMSTNEFNKTATKEALARNGIDPPAPRPITAIIQEKVQEATTINATASVTAFVTDKVSKGVSLAAQTASEYFAQTALSGWIASQWLALKSWVGFGAKAAEKARASAVNTALAASRAGTKPVVPPAPPLP